MEFRDYQKDVIKRVIDNFDKYNHFFINSPTGSGKTLMVIEIINRLKNSGIINGVLYFVRTINEYSSVLRDVKKFGYNLRVTGMIGKHRLCDFEMKWLAEELEHEVNICQLCPKYKRGYDGVSYDDIISKQSIYEALNTVPKNYCKYETLKLMIENSDIVLLSLPYLIGKPRILIDQLKQYDLIVVDEAHNLDNINQFVSVTLSLRDIEILKKNNFNVDALLEFHRRVYDESKSIKFVDKNEFIDYAGSLDPEIMDVYNRINAGNLDGKVDIARAVLRIVRFYNNIDAGYLDLFVTKRGFKLLVTDVGELLSRSITTRSIMMSGTMPPNDYIEKIWGLKGMYIDVEKEYSLFKSNRVWLWDNGVTMKYEVRDKMFDRYKERLRKLLRGLPKAVLVVFPSYDVMNQFKDVIKEFDGVVEDEKTRIETVINEVLNGKNYIYCVAGGKITEGVEIVKDNHSMIKSIVMVGVPYPVPDDYQKRRSEKIMKKIGRGDVFRYAVHTPALVLTKQAVGRGIRFPSDKNIIVLMDRRFKYFFDELGVDNVYKIKY